ETESDACFRTLTVTATDACGNVGTATRSYRVAQPVDLDLDGPAEGALVPPPASLSWEVVGPAQCSNGVTAEVRAPGANQNVGYVEGSDLPNSGSYAITLDVRDCRGPPRQLIRNFTVNGDPIASAAGPYVADEGAGLQIDGSASRPPEAGDNITAYEWDFGAARPGGFQAGAVLEAFPTEEDGEFVGQLRVTDSLGAVGTVQFNVTINDVDPIPALSAPDRVAQGAEFEADASDSRPGSAADLITTYLWNWGDGSPVEQTNDPNATHSYVNDGIYTIRLTVRDEDSERFVTRQIEVFDVNPEISTSPRTATRSPRCSSPPTSPPAHPAIPSRATPGTSATAPRRS
ncbi:MAG: PKD domain-containing protein, partial [Planctomycetota bacterium]